MTQQESSDGNSGRAVSLASYATRSQRTTDLASSVFFSSLTKARKRVKETIAA